jgi:ribonuclease D
MTDKNEINVALAAAESPIMIETETALQEAVSEWLSGKLLGIDTEFVRERTWRANIGLVQVSDGRKVWLVDPLKTGPLHALSSVLESQSVIKILHSPSEDLGVLLNATDSAPEPMFDTQIACAMLGQSLQMGYHKSVEWLFDITLDKGETRSNWCKRPLRPAQLHYASLDVCLLPAMQTRLADRLESLGRAAWLAEDSARLVSKALQPVDPERAWMRINGYGRLDGVSLAILKSLASWRDKEAEKRNLARGFVLKDATLMMLAREQPPDLATIARLHDWHPAVLQRHGKTLLRLINEVLKEGIAAPVPPRMRSEHKQLFVEMREFVQETAKHLAIDPALLASKRELENFILLPAGAPLPERLLGWRKEVITGELVRLKEKHHA